MIIKQIYTYNNYRNFNYIIACSSTREAILIDPLASRKCLEVAMSWGKSMWGGTDKIIVPETRNLKLLHIPGAGIDGIDFSKLPKECKVCNVYEHEITIAEYCVANILNWQTNMIKIHNNFKNLNWKDSLIFSGVSHSELNNKKIGILGYGRIGKEVAKRLKPFDVELVGFTRINRKKDRYLNKIYSSKKLSEIVSSLDFLILACPLTSETKNIINNKILKLMKKESVIINIARRWRKLQRKSFRDF